MPTIIKFNYSTSAIIKNIINLKNNNEIRRKKTYSLLKIYQNKQKYHGTNLVNFNSLTPPPHSYPPPPKKKKKKKTKPTCTHKNLTLILYNSKHIFHLQLTELPFCFAYALSYIVVYTCCYCFFHKRKKQVHKCYKNSNYF